LVGTAPKACRTVACFVAVLAATFVLVWPLSAKAAGAARSATAVKLSVRYRFSIDCLRFDKSPPARALVGSARQARFTNLPAGDSRSFIFLERYIAIIFLARHLRMNSS
jgi:hypothetical protein